MSKLVKPEIKGDEDGDGNGRGYGDGDAGVCGGIGGD